jgi:hypothetical protein
VKLESRFGFGDRVIIDGDRSLVARVISFTFRSHCAQVEVGWVHNGAAQTASVDEWRLQLAD